jgi:hypothetical protein
MAGESVGEVGNDVEVSRLEFGQRSDGEELKATLKNESQRIDQGSGCHQKVQLKLPVGR